jgi:hypothetical protein
MVSNHPKVIERTKNNFKKLQNKLNEYNEKIEEKSMFNE